MKRMLKLMVVAVALTFAGSALGATQLSGEEKQFLQNAAALGAAEVQIGKLAQQHGSSAAVKQHGAMIVAEHSKANDQLSALAKSKGLDVKLAPAGSQKQMIDALAKKSGAEFDKAYIEQQEQGHRKAIGMFQDAQRNAKDPDIKAFAQDQVPHLQSHLAAIQSQGGTRTTETRTQERRMGPGESAQPSRRQKSEGAVRVE